MSGPDYCPASFLLMGVILAAFCIYLLKKISIEQDSVHMSEEGNQDCLYGCLFYSIVSPYKYKTKRSVKLW